MEEPIRKPLHFVAPSRKDLRAMPEEVQDVFGSALLDAQYGDNPEGARVFGEGLPSQVLKLAEDFDGNTYRAAFTVALPRAVYVLEVFVKKSRTGAATPKHIKDRIRARLKVAEEHHERTYG